MTFEQIAAWAGGLTTILGLISWGYNSMRKIDIRDEYEANKKIVDEKFEEGSAKFESIEKSLKELTISLNNVKTKVDEIDRNYDKYLAKLDKVIESNNEILLKVTRLETIHENKQ